MTPWELADLADRALSAALEQEALWTACWERAALCTPGGALRAYYILAADQFARAGAVAMGRYRGLVSAMAGAGQW